MNGLIARTVTPSEMDVLREQLLRLGDIISFSDNVKFAARIASIGMMREVGTLNDEMARFLFDGETGLVINRSSLKAELVQSGGVEGVRIWSTETPTIELRFPGIRPLLDPRFSFDKSGQVRQLVIFPETVYRFMKSQGVELVLVKPWAMNTIFGGFHPSMNFYQTNIWELTNNDAVRFARLVSDRQVPFLGTHDFVAHIAGTDGRKWGALSAHGRRLSEHFDRYFNGIKSPSLASLVLPYVAGVLLDDLAQPNSYDDETRMLPLKLVCEEFEKKSIRPEEQRVLAKFPDHYEHLINLARFKPLADVQMRARDFVQNLVAELNGYSIRVS